MNLGEAIKMARKQRGLKQNTFAEMCDITPAYLSMIENNQKEPTIATVKIIGEKLNIPAPFLFFMAIDEEDIKPEKREAFKLISPALKSLIGEFFIDKLNNGN